MRLITLLILLLLTSCTTRYNSKFHELINTDDEYLEVSYCLTSEYMGDDILDSYKDTCKDIIKRYNND